MSWMWHLLFWLVLPVSMWLALWSYGELRRLR